MRIEEQQLKAFLLDSELVEKEDKKKSESNLSRLKAYILGIPFVNLKGLKIDQDILKFIPEPIAKKHKIIAFKKTDQALEVAMLDPEDLETITFIKKTSNLKILPRLTDSESMNFVLSQYQKSLQAEFGDLVGKEDEAEFNENALHIQKEMLSNEEVFGENLEKSAEELPVVRIVDTLLRHAILEKASDIHIEPMEKDVLVRYRVDGILRDAMT